MEFLTNYSSPGDTLATFAQFISSWILIFALTIGLNVALIVCFFVMCKNVSRIRKQLTGAGVPKSARTQEQEKIISELQNLTQRQQQNIKMLEDQLHETRKTNQLLEQLIKKDTERV